MYDYDIKGYSFLNGFTVGEPHSGMLIPVYSWPWFGVYLGGISGAYSWLILQSVRTSKSPR